MYLVENAYNVLLSGFTTVQSPGAEIDKYLRDMDGGGQGAGAASPDLAAFDQRERPARRIEIRAFVRKVVSRRRRLRQDLRDQEHPRRRRPDA